MERLRFVVRGFKDIILELDLHQRASGHFMRYYKLILNNTGQLKQYLRVEVEKLVTLRSQRPVSEVNERR